MATTHYRSCPLCEATCGVAIDVDGAQVTSIRGDADDPFSRGYLCPKATALADLHHDPDRLRRPMIRDGATWREAGWDEALELVARRLRAIRTDHGKDAVAVYQGNPTGHNLGLLTYGQLLLRKLGTRNAYSATSLDQLPHMLAALTMFGDQLLMPVPDLDRTDCMLALGANPLASNGSIMTAPDVKGRLKALLARGGSLIVVDPRATETAALASQHLFIRPGTDALFLLSLLHVLFAEGLARPGRLAGFTDGLAELEAIARAYPPARTAATTGITAAQVTAVARALAAAQRPVVYGRLGVCTQAFGGVAAWLCYAVNVVLGALDRVGGLMFTTPAIDALPLARTLGYDGGFARWHSRVRGLPEFGGELPAVTLVDEIETAGPGQIRALITSAGNPVLSAPGGPRLERALATLDFMVSIDPHLNETTQHAHVILPPTSALERSDYDLAFAAFSVRNVARYSPAVFARGDDQRHDWEICAELAARLYVPGPLVDLAVRAARALPPERVLELGLRAGPHRLSMAKLRAAPHGLDLGALEPRLPARLRHRDRRVQLAPAIYQRDLARLDATLTAGRPADALTLIGRRDLRSNNSWMHNSARLVKGKPRCTLLMHPDDAGARGLADGDTARLASAVGAVEVPVELTTSIMPGVVSLPHGWGHHRKGARLAVAAAHAGVSMNDVTDPACVDALTGTAILAGQDVTVARAAAGAVA
ncbi:MAG: molybdopterin-dependent oxidoreductase [Myxococcales bacterium]|nr:molybdopterin-dependent oxidoreductase [Myxococcales bacterium]